MNPLRIALFADCFHEVNGAAHTLRQYQAFAERHSLPLLSIHSGPETRCFTQGSVTTLELKRSAASVGIDADFGIDPLLWRYWQRIGEELTMFKPDIVHIISPGDFGILGACWAYRLKVPVAGSFHTNLHQFAAARLEKTLQFCPGPMRRFICQSVEEICGKGLLKFYEIPTLLLAPSTELQQWLADGAGRPCRLMRRGVDIDLFHPSRRKRQDGEFHLGYVGRLVQEKGVRFLADLEQALVERGINSYRFVIVGGGNERSWLEKHLRRAEFTGVLRGEALAAAYANLDLFVFPSRTDAFGNVVQEAMASGVPAVVTNEGGPKYLVNSGVNGYVTLDERDFIDKTIELVKDPRTLRRMRLAARQAACAASWDQVFGEVWQSYEVCLRLRRSQSPATDVERTDWLTHSPGVRIAFHRLGGSDQDGATKSRGLHEREAQ